jgi:hypothetical protein
MNVAMHHTTSTKQFTVEVVYNGVTKPLTVEPEQQVTAVLARAITLFNITQNQHLLSLFREDGALVQENESAERAGLKPNEVLLLRQNTVKGGGVPLLRLTSAVLANTFEMLRACGRGECECVVYWTGEVAANAIDAVEHPVHERSPYGYQIDDRWLTRFGFRLARDRRSVKVQVHTHPGHAFHSQTDDDWPVVAQKGFVSVVIPRFAMGGANLENAWIGRLQHDGTWQRLTSASDVFVFA